MPPSLCSLDTPHVSVIRLTKVHGDFRFFLGSLETLRFLKQERLYSGPPARARCPAIRSKTQLTYRNERNYGTARMRGEMLCDTEDKDLGNHKTGRLEKEGRRFVQRGKAKA